MKLSPTMIEGLRSMAVESDRINGKSVFARPNENTGRALVARGLIERADVTFAWPRYTITQAGRDVLAAQSGK